MSTAEELHQIIKRSIRENKNFKIHRAGNEDDSMWISGFQNTKTRCFSVDDLMSYWLVVDESKQPARIPDGELKGRA